MHENAQGVCRGHKWVAENESAVTQPRWENKFVGSHDLQRKVDNEGRVFIWCRKCAGCSTQCLRKRQRDVSRPNDAIIPYQLSFLEYGKRPHRITRRRIPRQNSQSHEARILPVEGVA